MIKYKRSRECMLKLRASSLNGLEQICRNIRPISWLNIILLDFLLLSELLIVSLCTDVPISCSASELVFWLNVWVKYSNLECESNVLSGGLCNTTVSNIPFSCVNAVKYQISVNIESSTL